MKEKPVMKEKTRELIYSLISNYDSQLIGTVRWEWGMEDEIDIVFEQYIKPIIEEEAKPQLT